MLPISITTHDYSISCGWKAVQINICEYLRYNGYGSCSLLN